MSAVAHQLDFEAERRRDLESLYTARFFRRRFAITPRLVEAVSRAIAKEPHELSCLYIWGVHAKPAPDAHDDDTISHLHALLKRMEVHLQVKVILDVLLADSHGELNEVAVDRSAPYATGITRRLEQRGWRVYRMSDLWRNANITRTSIDELGSRLDVVSTAPRLLLFAGKHYRGTSAERGARRYLAARLLEQPVVSERFKGHLLLTPVEPTLDAIQPDMPIMHIWTRKKGCSAKPWFAPERV
ncbi:MAG TPA: hypothetical protein VGC79_21680 [Polyangiaceae bacterium]